MIHIVGTLLGLGFGPGLVVDIFSLFILSLFLPYILGHGSINPTALRNIKYYCATDPRHRPEYGECVCDPRR